jgi:hypothetical protein
LPLLLLLPLLLVALLLLWAVLVPLGLWQRYRLGKTRRRALPWLTRLNSWLLLVSAGVFFASAWIAGFWVDAALAHAAAGQAIGLLLGQVGLSLTRFQLEPSGLFYTPNRWIVLSLTLLVAARVGYGLVRAWRAWGDDADNAWLSQQGSMLTVGGVVLGYYLAYTWGLRRRLPRQ